MALQQPGDRHTLWSFFRGKVHVTQTPRLWPSSGSKEAARGIAVIPSRDAEDRGRPASALPLTAGEPLTWHACDWH